MCPRIQCLPATHLKLIERAHSSRGNTVVESSSLVSVLFREAFSHPYISFFHLLVNGFSVTSFRTFSKTLYLHYSGGRYRWQRRRKIFFSTGAKHNKNKIHVEGHKMICLYKCGRWSKIVLLQKDLFFLLFHAIFHLDTPPPP